MYQVLDFLIHFFNFSDFRASVEAGFWTDFHAGLHVMSDVLTGLAFMMLPVIIAIYLLRQGKKIHFNGLYILFAAFFLAVAFTFLADAFMFWIPAYRINTFVRLVTLILSVVTIYYVLKVLPIASSLRSQKDLQQEIEKRTDTEEELKKKNDQLMEAERTAKLGYGFWDICRGHVEFSEMACDIMGLLPGSFVQYEKLAAQVHPADIRFVKDSIQKNLKNSVFRQFYFRVLTDRMVVKHVLVRGMVVRNVEGQAVAVKGTLQDVTEIRFHIQRIEQQNKRLKKIAWLQSHRMRSPVATILGLAELFNTENPADPMNAELMQNLKEQAYYLDKMIHEVDGLTRENAPVAV